MMSLVIATPCCLHSEIKEDTALRCVELQLLLFCVAMGLLPVCSLSQRNSAQPQNVPAP
jgi:hypothetical protein